MPVAPSYDSGFVTPPVTLGNPPGADNVTTYYLQGANFTNSGDTDAFVQLSDGSGKSVMEDTKIPAHDTKPLEWPFMPIVGLQWQVSGPNPAAVTGKLWGYSAWPF